METNSIDRKLIQLIVVMLFNLIGGAGCILLMGGLNGYSIAGMAIVIIVCWLAMQAVNRTAQRRNTSRRQMRHIGRFSVPMRDPESGTIWYSTPTGVEYAQEDGWEVAGQEISVRYEGICPGCGHAIDDHPHQDTALANLLCNTWYQTQEKEQ